MFVRACLTWQDAYDPTELAVTEGEILVQKSIRDDWWLVYRPSTKMAGYAPAACFLLLSEEEVQQLSPDLERASEASQDGIVVQVCACV